MSIDGNPTRIYSANGTLSFDDSFPLASKEEYQTANRCNSGIFEALKAGENIHLADGYFVLDEALNLVQDWQIV